MVRSAFPRAHDRGPGLPAHTRVGYPHPVHVDPRAYPARHPRSMALRPHGQRCGGDRY